ncbi:MAG TPA: ATP-binding protein [Thermoanaerobaculia bacterium]|jgi:predicted AAA+ superfamily ATPase|nr:ATP-binding protein [Thermoanaerobaculia bacterium]
MIPRALETVLHDVARQYPVVTLTGPRQSGKTTLVREAFPDHAYASLEEPDLREYALADPRGFLAQFAGNVILDEVQRAPDLFSYIQSIVDRDDVPGRYILSGSQNFLLLRSIGQSLAGRSAVLHLLPLSLAELEGRQPFTLEALGKEIPGASRESSPDFMDILFRGFYPRIHDKGLDPSTWHSGYYQTYIERDVREVLNVGDIEAFGRFVRLCAGRNGQLLNLSSLANDCGITHTTARRWISILEASFLVLLLRPYHANFGKRLIKSPKLYFIDTGLLCYLLRIQSPEDLRLHGSRGSIFESFVVADLLKNFLNRGREADLYFWRDSTGHEIDVVIDRGRERVAVEIKSAQTVAEDFFAGIDFWRKLVGDPEAPSALVYGGNRSFRRSGVAVQSWSTL